MDQNDGEVDAPAEPVGADAILVLEWGKIAHNRPPETDQR